MNIPCNLCVFGQGLKWKNKKNNLEKKGQKVVETEKFGTCI